MRMGPQWHLAVLLFLLSMAQGDKSGEDKLAMGPTVALKCPKTSGQFEHPIYCNIFLECFQSEPTVVKCPRGKVFSEGTKSCQIHEIVDCRGRKETSMAWRECPIPFGLEQGQSDGNVTGTRYLNSGDAYEEKSFDQDNEIAEDVLRLLQLGDEEIELYPEVTSFALVIGITGAGKSVLTKFVGGERCQLESVYNDWGFFILDKYESVGNQSIISKILLPELTVHAATGLAFYDCPGYTDTRNASVEIANSFFIKKVADHARELKIVVVVHYNTMLENRAYFLDLLKQLHAFIKSPAKLVHSFAMVVNFVNSLMSDTQVLTHVQVFLLNIRADLGNIWANEPQLLATALEIIGILLSTDEDGQLTRIGLLRVPTEEGCLDDMEAFRCAKENLQTLIWNNLEFASTNEDDFGFSLSDNALLVSSEVVDSINRRIANNISDFSARVGPEYLDVLVEFASGEGDVDHAAELLRSIGATSYPLCEEVQGLSPAAYTTEIVGVVRTFHNDMNDTLFLEMDRLTGYLEFFNQALEGGISMTPTLWIQPLLLMKSTVLSFAKATAPVFEANIKSLLRMISNAMETDLKARLDSFKLGDVNLDLPALRASMLALTTTTISVCDDRDRKEPTACMNEIIANIRSIGAEVTNGDIAILHDRAARLQAIYDAVGNGTAVNPSEWSQPLLTCRTNIVLHLLDICLVDPHLQF